MSGIFKAFLVVLVLNLVYFGRTVAQTSTTSPPSTPCVSRSNTSCDECLQNVTCLWCDQTGQCLEYPVRNILPPRSVCPLNDARWGVCWVNFQVLIITVAVLAGVLFIGVLVCCCCCCRCDRVGNRNKREDAKIERENRARKDRQKARRTEMQMRHDEIRQKYGLAKDNPYARMNEH